MKINKPLLIKTTGVLIAVTFIVAVGLALKANQPTVNEFSSNGVTTKNGIQYISLKAGLGYSPNRIQAQSSIPTKLEIETNNTYDCTAFLNIPELNIKKFLPPTGKTEIELDSRAAGDQIEGFCGSDTYKFVIKFS